MDMLTARKIKLHGMKDYRWKTKDKITQYKGVISLYKRDKKVNDTDANVNLRKQKTILSNLKKTIITSRTKLDNATFGDRQKIRNVLAEDKQMQLAFQHLPAEKIIEHIHQENFTKRKYLDLLHYDKAMKGARLINMKLAYAEMEDQTKLDSPGNLPVEKQCQIITGSLQDAILIKEGAIVVNETYKKILSVMKKDSIYFDSLLYSLRMDWFKQNKCTMSTMILGQLATEYLDDRKQEFVTLESVVKRDMASRNREISEMRTKVNSLNKNIKFYIRRDSDTSLEIVDSETTNQDLQDDIDGVIRYLDLMKSSFYVTYYESLFPCIRRQYRHMLRLEKLKDTTIENRNRLQKKLDHAEQMYNSLANTMNDTTINYMQEKQEILEETRSAAESTLYCNRMKTKLSDLILVIKVALQQMEDMCKVVRDPIKEKAKKMSGTAAHFDSVINVDVIKNTLELRENPQQIVQLLVPKLQALSRLAIKMDNRIRDRAVTWMERLVAKRAHTIVVDQPMAPQSLLEISFEDGSVPTRQDIKAQSEQVVLMNTEDDDEK